MASQENNNVGGTYHRTDGSAYEVWFLDCRNQHSGWRWANVFPDEDGDLIFAGPTSYSFDTHDAARSAALVSA